MSSEKRSKQPLIRWTADEDASLRKLVHEHGTSEWTLIASKLEGGKRSNQQCANRWKVIDPSLSTGKFSAAEDASLTMLVQEHGESAWTLIASKLEGGRRSDQRCQSRWRTIDPSLSTGKFSAVEDASLTTLVHEHGASTWAFIASKLEGGKRNDLQCRDRWKAIDPSLSKGKFSAAEDASLTKLVHEHASAWVLIASKLEGGKRNVRQCQSRWRTLGKSNGKGSSSSSSSSSSTKQSASSKPPSKLEADSDNDDDSSVDDDATFEHVLFDGFSLVAAAAPQQSRKRKSPDDDDSSVDDDESFQHVLIDGFGLALAAAAPHQSRKRKSTESGTGGVSNKPWVEL
jgi:hypothetical protein